MINQVYVFLFFTSAALSTSATSESVIIRAHVYHRDSINSRRDNYSFALDSTTTYVQLNEASYFMNLSIGTPPHHVVVTMDTGSSFFWVQCVTCAECLYKQDAPLFNQKESSSFRPYLCDKDPCPRLDQAYGFCENSFCKYEVRYQDHSNSTGIVASETITLTTIEGEPFILDNFYLGCGYDNEGKFDPKEQGLIGLGAGRESLITRLILQSMGSSHTAYLLFLAMHKDRASLPLAKMCLLIHPR